MGTYRGGRYRRKLRPVRDDDRPEREPGLYVMPVVAAALLVTGLTLGCLGYLTWF